MRAKYRIPPEGVDMLRGDVAFHVREDLEPLGASVTSAFVTDDHLFVEVDGLDPSIREHRAAMGRGAGLGGELWEGEWPPTNSESISV